MNPRSIEATGKTVKEAMQKGCAQLGVDSADVDIQVLEVGTPGLFGLFGKPAKVRLTVRKNELDLELPVMSLDQPAKGRTEGKKREKPKQEKKPEPVKAEKPPRAERPKVEKAPKPEEEEAETAASEQPEEEAAPAPKSGRRRRRNRGPKEEREPQPERVVETIPAPLPEPEPFVETPEDQLTEVAKDARDFLSGLTASMNVPAQIAVQEGEEQLRMVLSGENMSILIGRRGETLDAIQYLTSLHVNRAREDYLRVSLDTENYRAKREEALRKLAVRMANRCKKSGRRVALEPMNPYERRILHSALQADPEVTTHSEGEEPYRRVIITMK